MLERDLEARFRRRVVAAGGVVVKLAPTVRGVPDRLVILGGALHLVELKTEKGRMRAGQIVWAERAAARGVIVVVLRGPAEVDAWVERNRA